MDETVIETRNLTKTFRGGVVAVSALDLKISRGTVYGLVGRNGVGKTTALRLLMGLLRPDSGSAEVLGCDLWKAPRRIRARVAYVSQSQQLHGWMTLAELCRYTGQCYDEWDAPLLRSLADRWGLAWNRQVGAMSSGEQRKAGMLLAIAGHPEVLILDEPVANLDPIARREVLDALIEIMGLDRRCTILLSTHLISDLERIAEFVGIMDRGRLVMSDRLEDLQTFVKRVQVIFPGMNTPPAFAIPGALRSRTCGPVATAIVRLAGDPQLDCVRNLPGTRVNIFPVGLEELFVELFGSASADKSSSPEMTPQFDEPPSKILSIQEG
jgi:ABC-2 type transport system ATP-binding protein